MLQETVHESSVPLGIASWLCVDPGRLLGHAWMMSCNEAVARFDQTKN